MNNLYVLEKMMEWKMKEMEQFYHHHSLESKKEGYMARVLQGFKAKNLRTATSCCCSC